MTNIYINENINKTFQPFVTNDSKANPSYTKKEDKSLLHTLNTLENDTYERLKQKKRKITGLIAIGSTATLAAIAFIAIATGKSQKISKKMLTLFGGVESKFADVKDKHIHKILTTTFGFFDRFAKVFTNSSPIKDYTLHQVLGQTKITRNIRTFLSNIFTKENKNSVLKSLKTSKESYNEFISSVEKAVGSSPSSIKETEKFKEMEQLLAKAKETPEFLSEKHFNENYSTMEKDMCFLNNQMSLKRLFSKEALQGFVPESILAERRAKYVEALIDKKNNISCSFADMSQYARIRLDDTNIIIYSIKDSKLQKNLRNCSLTLDNSLKNYVKQASDKSTRDPNLKLIQNNIKTFKEEVDSLASSDIKDKLLLHIDEYENLFKDHKPGVVQDIRMLAGEVWGDKSEFDLNIKKKATAHSKDLNVSLTRTINMFDKQRDITLGSGPADVLGLLSPIVLFGVALSKDDTKDKRVGTSLELGIPIIGGVLVYLRTLALQFNGVKALATSTGAAILLNVAGSLIYKKYMAHQELARKKESESTPQQL